MKKLITTLTLSIAVTVSFAQAGAKYATGGNATSTGDILGTTNSQPINFATNNTIKMVLDASGNLRLVNFAGTGNRIVTTDANGNLSALPQGITGQYLSSNGTWQNLPAVIQPWNISGNNLFYNTGNVGIGAVPNSAYKLDVAGDARIQNNLYVGGGILISQKVEATNSLKTDTVRSASGSTKFASDVVLKQQFQVDGNSLFNGNVQAPAIQTGNLNVNGTANFNTPIQANQGLNFSGSNSFRYSNNNQTETFSLGKSANTNLILPPCINFNPGQTNSGGIILDVVGAIVARDASNLHPTIMGFDGANHILEAGSTGAITSSGAFLVNYYCGKPTAINTGANGGHVYVGGIGNVYLSKTIIGNQTQTTGPHTDAILTVNGKMVAKSCYIRIVDWADYVFAKDYKLPNLYDIEKYYIANKHLPEIPSEKEVIENGIDVAEINKLLLKKIEEITILMVKQQKQIDALELKTK